MRQIKMLLRFKPIGFFIFVTTLAFVYLSCCNHNYGELDDVFKLLEDKSPDYMINQFKKSNIDSVIINNSKYNSIFIDAANIVMRDSIAASNIKNVFESYGIALVGEQVKWTIVAAFHNYLNKKKYNIPSLLENMIELSNKTYDKKNKHLSSE